jgi:hypothetical protein
MQKDGKFSKYVGHFFCANVVIKNNSTIKKGKKFNYLFCWESSEKVLLPIAPKILGVFLL